MATALGLDALQRQGPNPVTSAAPVGSVEENVRRTLEEMKKHNVVLGIVGGGAKEVDQFLSLAPGRILGSAAFGRPGLSVDSLRAGCRRLLVG